MDFKRTLPFINSHFRYWKNEPSISFLPRLPARQGLRFPSDQGPEISDP